MKKSIILSIALTAFFFSSVYSEPFNVCQGDVVLSSQHDVTFFNCTEVTGTLTISGEDITDLSGLGQLKKVGGLIIRGNLNLQLLNYMSQVQLDPMSAKPLVIIDNNPQLTYLGLNLQSSSYGPVEITNNASLTSINSFSNLNTVLGHLRITGNDSLTSTWGIQNVTQIIRSNENPIAELQIEDNSLLTELFFYSLERIQGDGALLSITNNKTLSNIGYLSSLSTIEGTTNGASVVISNNPKLHDLKGFAGLVHLRGSPAASIVLSDNPSLENIDDLISLKMSPDDLLGTLSVTIKNNPQLTRCCGVFPLLESVAAESSNIELSITGNGADCTTEKILIGGTCSVCLFDVTLVNQAEVDAFECPIVNGDLVIAGEDIVNLDGLSELQSVGGRLSIGNNPLLHKINGFESLQNVDGNIFIHSHNALDEVLGFNNLIKTGEGISFSYNENLKTIQGFSSIESAGSVGVDMNPNLTAIEGFSSMVRIESGLSFTNNTSLNSVPAFENVVTLGSFQVGGNENLTMIDGPPLVTIIDNITISDNRSLTTLEGFESLTSVMHTVNISENPELTSIQAFASLDSIGESLSVDSNTKLIDLNAFSSLRRLGSISLARNDNLINIDGLSSLERLHGAGWYFIYDIFIAGNNSLTNLDGFSALTNTEINAIRVSDNKSLVNVNSLTTITKVLGALEITGNEALLSFNGLRNVESVPPGGPFQPYVSISNNASLLNLDGLASLKVISGNGATLDVSDNKSLQNIDGLSSLTTVSGGGRGVGVFIINNDAIKNIDGLASFINFGYGVAGNIVIDDNALLENVNGLSNLPLKFQGNLYVSVSRNPSLSDCAGLLPVLKSIGWEDVYRLYELGNLKIAENGSSSCTLEELLAVNGNMIIGFGLGGLGLSQDQITMDLAYPSYSAITKIEAKTIPPNVGSVEFKFSTGTTHVDNEYPYEFEIPVLQPGSSYTLIADVYSQPNKQGLKGAGKTLTLDVVNTAAVTRFFCR